MVDLLTKREAATIVGLHPAYIMQLAKRGNFPQPVKLGPGVKSAVRFVESEIHDWIAVRLAARKKAGA